MLARLAALAAAAVLALPVAAQQIAIGLAADVTSIDPHYHVLGPNQNISEHVFEALIGKDEKQRLKPALALSWKPIDDTHAYIYTSPKRKFKVTFFSRCSELKWAIFARIETRPSSMTCLSVGDTLVFGRGSLFPSRRFEFEERCTITEIEGVPVDEKEAMPAKPSEAPPSP